jgi:hypothetical protein
LSINSAVFDAILRNLPDFSKINRVFSLMPLRSFQFLSASPASFIKPARVAACD